MDFDYSVGTNIACQQMVVEALDFARLKILDLDLSKLGEDIVACELLVMSPGSLADCGFGAGQPDF